MIHAIRIDYPKGSVLQLFTHKEAAQACLACLEMATATLKIQCPGARVSAISSTDYADIKTICAMVGHAEKP